MPTVTAPLLSFGASGQIAKAHVYATWKGRAYARRYQVPTYSRTDEQGLTRQAFSWLNSVYKLAPSLFTDAWVAYEKGKVLTARNGFIKFNLPLVRPTGALTDFVFSPGALGGPTPASAVATPGSGQLSVAVTAPAVLPQGWTIFGAVAACIADQDAQTDNLYTITAAQDLTSTYACVLTGLDAVLYQVGAWLIWNRPDGTKAYSPSIQTTGTPS